LKIEKEILTEQLYSEILPLARKCWEEGTRNKGESCAYYGERDFAVEPDFPEYLNLAARDALLLLTLRDGEVLKGYALGILYGSLHHKGIRCGFGDSVYIEPDCRSFTTALINRFEAEFKAAGAHIIGWPVHINGPVYGILKARGYVGDDIVMEKRLPVAENRQCA
jgi:hypothetical protein